MPCCAAQTAVALEAEPHQMRSRRPAECGSRRSSPAGWRTSGAGWAGEALALQQLEEGLGVAAAHVGIALALGRRVAEVPPALDHLLGRAAAEPELQAPAADEVGRPASSTM